MRNGTARRRHTVRPVRKARRPLLSDDYGGELRFDCCPTPVDLLPLMYADGDKLLYVDCLELGEERCPVCENMSTTIDMPTSPFFVECCEDCETVMLGTVLDTGILMILIFDIVRDEWNAILTFCHSFDCDGEAFQEALTDAWLWRRMIGVALADVLAQVDGSRSHVRMITRWGPIATAQPALDAMLASEYT